METIGVYCSHAIAPESFDAIMTGMGAYTTGGVAVEYCLERNAAAIYVTLEPLDTTDRDSLERVQRKLPWRPHSVILVSVGHHEGSLLLGFELAASINDRWVAFVDFGGLTQWEIRYQEWQQARRNRPS
jgi:hypothetical protein